MISVFHRSPRAWLPVFVISPPSSFNAALYLIFISEYDVLLPPAASLTSTFLRIRSSISREAVSCEHLASLAHLDEVSLPSKPR